MIPVLRFRDLNIPAGETLRRHAEIAKKNGYVYWGWMKRNREILPLEVFRQLARQCQTAPQTVLLFDSGHEAVYLAQLLGIHAFPGGESTPTPEPRRTPLYMAEASLPAWFKVSKIELDALNLIELPLSALPTLTESSEEPGNYPLSKLRASDATFWITNCTIPKKQK
jgi:hypothetical protein